MKMLIPYLGMESYPGLLVMTGRYHDAQGGGEQNLEALGQSAPNDQEEDEGNK